MTGGFQIKKMWELRFQPMDVDDQFLNLQIRSVTSSSSYMSGCDGIEIQPEDTSERLANEKETEALQLGNKTASWKRQNILAGKKF